MILLYHELTLVVYFTTLLSLSPHSMIVVSRSAVSSFERTGCCCYFFFFLSVLLFMRDDIGHTTHTVILSAAAESKDENTVLTSIALTPFD
jgi:hypothetical protein